MNDEYLNSLLDDADRVVATDLYPARCRTVIANLASELRKQTADLNESREYGSALVAELKDRAAKTDALLAMANSMDADFAAASDLPAAGEMQTAIIRRAQGILTQYLIPDGIDGPTAIDQLLGLLDGPDQRAAQSAWDKATGGVNGS